MGLLEKLKRALTIERFIYDAPSEKNMDVTYNAISTISRCADLIINSAAKVPFVVMEDKGNVYSAVESPPKLFERIRNPSTETDLYSFKRRIYRDLFYRGNCLLYDTGVDFQYIENYQVQNGIYIIADKYRLTRDEIVLFNMLEPQSGVFGKPYISRIDDEISLISKMVSFQEQYFKNNGIPGVIIQSKRPLSPRLKEKKIEEFKNMLSIMNGKAGAPYILDDEDEIKELQHSFKDLQFQESLENLDSRIIKNLGIPEALINGGNNANISPNVKLFYYTTVADFLSVVASEFTYYAKKKNPGKWKNLVVLPKFSGVPLLQDDFNKLSGSVRSLYTTGVINKNEARNMINLEKVEGGDIFVVPENIAGSANNIDEGGRPSDS